MRRQPRPSRAILVLESPWELDAADANRTSVLPFIEGIAKLAGDVEVYHANFYDQDSFVKALNYLCKSRFQNALLYVAAHGFKEEVGGVRVGTVLSQVGDQSKHSNITGVLFGSCFVGENTSTIESLLEGNNLKWCAGYSSTSDWLTGTLIDCSILAKMVDLDKSDFDDRMMIIDRLVGAVNAFSGEAYIGDDYLERPVRLRDSLRFVVQPNGSGQRARDVTDSVVGFAFGPRIEEAD